MKMHPANWADIPNVGKGIEEDYIVAWSIEPRPKVRVGPREWSGWDRAYQGTSGCVYSAFNTMSGEDQSQALVNLAAHLMFQGIDPREIEREFSKIELWRTMSVLLPMGRVERATLQDDSTGVWAWNPHNPG